MDIYFERIRPLFDKSGKGDAELEREIGIPAKKISQWNARFTKSYDKYITQIANYFHVSTDYLLGNTDDQSLNEKRADSVPATQDDPVLMELYSLIEKMSEAEKLHLLEKARKIMDI